MSHWEAMFWTGVAIGTGLALVGYLLVKLL